jgi:hypothetical protein
MTITDLHETYTSSTKFCKKNSYNEFNENMTDGLVVGAKSQMDGRMEGSVLHVRRFYFYS